MKPGCQVAAFWLGAAAMTLTFSFLGFLVSTVAAIVVMLSTARTVRRNETTDQLPDKLGGIYRYYALVAGFAVGVISLSIFAIRNL